MPYVPKPPRPSTSLTFKERIEAVSTTWDNRGNATTKTITNSIYPEMEVARSDVSGRTRNKVRILKGGAIWKPCSSYTVTSRTINRQDGIILVVHQTSGRPLRRDVGPSLHSNPLRFVQRDGFLTATCRPTGIPAMTKSRLATELMQKVADRRTNYGESLAEARTTIWHLAKTASDLFFAYRSARKGDWSGVAHHLGVPKRRLKDGSSPANKWLEYQYGWLPMMADIYDTHRLITQGFKKETYLMSEVRQLSDSYTSTVTDGDEETIYYARSQYRAKVFFSVRDSDLSKLAQMGLINPVEVAWAVVPFSFVVDWFLPVGNFLEALTARCGVDFIDGFYGHRVTSNCRFLPDAPDVYQGKTAENSCWVQSDVMGYNRARMSDFPIPGLYWKNPFSSTHLVSAAALIRSLKW